MAALFGAATAVVWSVDAAFVKQSVDVLAHAGPLGLLTSWPLYAMIATGVLGTALLQGAYAARPPDLSFDGMLAVALVAWPSASSRARSPSGLMARMARWAVPARANKRASTRTGIPRRRWLSSY